MSWFSDNYEKVALGGAALIAVALGAVIFKNKGALDEVFNVDSVKQNKETGVRGFADILEVKDSLGGGHEIQQGDVDGRKVDLFTGVPLFSKKDDPLNPVDLLKSDPVHAGIPNIWWLKYEIDPGFSDSPDLDPDKDGFTNREEYDAETHPMDFKGHPNPIVKLKVVGVKTTQVHIKPTDYGGGKYVFKLQNKYEGDLNKMPGNVQGIKEGSVIPFDRDYMKNRFKLLKVLEVEIEKNGFKQTEKRWEIEDLKPNKAGIKYLFDRRGNMAGAPRREFGIMDSTVEMTLQALGQGGNPFKLEEKNSFSLPFDEKATEKPYLLKKVDLTNKTVEVEYKDKDGKVQIHSMKFK